MIRAFIKRYAFFICVLIITLVVTIINKGMGFDAFRTAGSSFKQMLTVLPPIMLLLSLMDVWVPREKMMRYMGKDSGFMGIFLSMLIGSLAAGPMYAAFPFTTVLLRKGVKFSNIIIFMGAWCVTKISTLMFEFTALGYRFTFIRLLVDIPGVIIMGYMVEWFIPKNDLDKIYLDSERIAE
jgi:uncharacterized membrane protein YraQ (UPF0718 family)